MFFRNVFVVCCILFLCSCKRDPSFFHIENLDNGTISILGHAGMGIGFKYPINSYESLETCFSIGADGSEMDVQMTKDSVLVLFHDRQLETSTSLKGSVSEKTWSELQSARYASPYSSSIKIERAEDVIARFDNQHRLFSFDCKLYSPASVDDKQYLGRFAHALTALIQKYKLQEWAHIESSDQDFLASLKLKDQNLQLFIYATDFTEGLEIANKLDLYGMIIHNENISASEVAVAHRSKRRIALFGLLSDNDNINAIEKSPDILQSDRIIHLLKVFGQYKK